MRKHAVLAALVCSGVLLAYGTGGAADAAEDPVDEAILAELDRLEPTGETEGCLTLSSASEVKAATEDRFLVRLSSERFYLSEMSRKCRGATGNRSALIYPGRRLCRNDRVTIVDGRTRAQLGWCAFGEFKEMKLRAGSD
jgi:hypothetical protein